MIDFGLAERFPGPEECTHLTAEQKWSCDLFVGKKLYQSPEIIAGRYAQQSKQPVKLYRADSADCWALGITMLGLITFTQFFCPATPSDTRFKLIVLPKTLEERGKGFIRVLQTYNRLMYIDEHSMDLLLRIYRYEDERYSISQIVQHKWLNPKEITI